MTDKQIIIDDVDVKDCKRRIGKNNYCRYYKRPCAENNYNCIWKKYLRKEQEFEELKNTVDYLRREFKKIKWTNKAISKQCENLNCKDLQKLKQTLTEIKEIVTNFYETGFLRTDNGFILINNNTCVETLDKILQKISEVLND